MKLLKEESVPKMTINAFEVMSRERRCTPVSSMPMRDCETGRQPTTYSSGGGSMPQIANPVLSNYNPFNIAAWTELEACLPFIATFFIVVFCCMGQINS